MLSHEAGRRYILNFTINQGKYSAIMIGRGLSLNLFGESLFYGPRKLDKGADTDLVYRFCRP